MRSQAETDSEEFRRKIEELHEEHRAELADARAEALRHAQIVHKLERVGSTFAPFTISSPSKLCRLSDPFRLHGRWY